MNIRRLTSLALAGAAALAALPALAAESYTLWDNFNNATAINPERWTALERTRQVRDGTARFIQRDIGTQAGDNTASWANWGINVRQTNDALRQMRAIVTMSAYDVTGCASNTAYPTIVQARIVGEFFNASGSAPASRINDVGAVVRLLRSSASADPATTVRVEGVVFRCTTTDCNTPESLGAVDLGTTTLGTAETLRVEWEPDMSRFNFQRGGNPRQSVVYDVDDSQPPFQWVRQIGTRTQVASCLSGPRGEASVSARFDNFAINNSAVTP